MSQQFVVFGRKPVQIVNLPVPGRGGTAGRGLGGAGGFVDGVDLGNGTTAKNSVSREAVFLLKSPDCRGGLGTDGAGDLAGVKSELLQLFLGVFDGRCGSGGAPGGRG